MRPDNKRTECHKGHHTNHLFTVLTKKGLYIKMSQVAQYIGIIKIMLSSADVVTYLRAKSWLNVQLKPKQMLR